MNGWMNRVTDGEKEKKKRKNEEENGGNLMSVHARFTPL
jgi:hypothetical protein